MRTAMGAAALIIAMQYFFKRRAENKSVLPIIFIGACFLAGFYYYKNNVGNSDIKGDFESREIIWKISKELIQKQKWVGYGDYSKLLTRYSQNHPDYDWHFGNLVLEHPHSSYLNFLLQSGAISFVLMGVFLLMILLQIRNLNGFNKAMMLLVLYWMLCGISWESLFNMTYTMDGVLFELSIFGLILHPELYLKKEEAEEEVGSNRLARLSTTEQEEY
jgi:O-antigen ligase